MRKQQERRTSVPRSVAVRGALNGAELILVRSDCNRRISSLPSPRKTSAHIPMKYEAGSPT